MRVLRTDFVVIGAGAVGLATALELAERGARVRVLERGQAGGESTWAGGGILSPLLPWDYGPAVNALAEYSRALFPAWCQGLQAVSGVDPELRPTGMLVLPPYDLERARAWCAGHRWDWALRASGEFLPRAGGATGLWLPGVYQARNPRLARALRGAALARGVEIIEGVAVTGLAASGGRVTGVRTARGPVEAGGVVLAAGAWSGALPGLAGLERRIFPVRGQMLLFRGEPGALSAIILENGRYLIPRADGQVLAGSTLEHVGFDKATTDPARSALLDFASRLAPQLNASTLVRHWSGLRPGSPDNVPVMARHPDFDNLYVNAGHFRYGVTMAPGSARLLADLMEGVAPAIDPGPYQWPTPPSTNAG